MIPTPEQWRDLTAQAFLVPGWTPTRQRLNVYGLEVEANWEEWVRFAEMILALESHLKEAGGRE